MEIVLLKWILLVQTSMDARKDIIKMEMDASNVCMDAQNAVRKMFVKHANLAMNGDSILVFVAQLKKSSLIVNRLIAFIIVKLVRTKKKVMEFGINYIPRIVCLVMNRKTYGLM